MWVVIIVWWTTRRHACLLLWHQHWIRTRTVMVRVAMYKLSWSYEQLHTTACIMPDSCFDEHIQYTDSYHTSCHVNSLSISSGIQHTCSRSTHTVVLQCLFIRLCNSTTGLLVLCGLAARVARRYLSTVCVTVRIALVCYSQAFGCLCFWFKSFGLVCIHFAYSSHISSDNQSNLTFRIGKSMGFASMHRTPICLLIFKNHTFRIRLLSNLTWG